MSELLQYFYKDFKKDFIAGLTRVIADCMLECRLFH